jgi:hypothetical protein
MFGEHRTKRTGNLREARFEWIADAQTDHTVRDNRVPASIAIDDAPTGALRAAIDAEDAHVRLWPLRQSLQFLLVDVEVGINILHIVVVFQSLGQPQHTARLGALELQEVFRNHGNFG